ncbi:MAG: glutaredoxin [Sandaracinus sp.]
MSHETKLPVRVYATSLCIWCWRAKLLLRRRGIPFETIDASHPQTRAWLREVTGRTTVPQIYFGERHVGGYDDLAALDARGGLTRAGLEP